MEGQVFKKPTRAVVSPLEMASFKSSACLNDFKLFLKELNGSVKGKTCSVEVASNKLTLSLIEIMTTLENWVDEIPPSKQPSRFGNKSFRVWHARLVEVGPALLGKALPEELHGAIVELSPYLCDSFGNSTRIDYGTDCAFKAGAFEKVHFPALILKVFAAYLKVTRKLQKVYWLEPAGSHGVWSLDDYCVLPFLFGSSQLSSQELLTPESVLSAATVDENAEEYLYFNAIQFILSVKSGGPFSEHSPMLHDISAVPTWSKVNAGMWKLYQGEVLGKFPVVQHILFGSLFPASWTLSRRVRDHEKASTMLEARAVEQKTQEECQEEKE